jgi:peptidoglycan/LPS O-acetylase OafA/YrhL
MSAGRESTGDWWRWILVLPSALLAHFAAAFVMGIVFGSMSRSWDPDYSDFPNPSFKLTLLRSFLEPAAFVYAGAAVAPRRRFIVSVGLSVLLAGFIIVTFVGATKARDFDWLYALCNALGLLALVAFCVHFYREEGWK